MNDQLKAAITAIRVVGIEAVTAANSGHPGIVLGATPILATLFANHFNFNVTNPQDFNRDRFVLSAGHGSALLYALFAAIQMPEVEVGELKSFRQLNSLYPGHPERNHIPGVEITTGPLGQGVAAAVGMAIAEAHLNALFRVDNQGVVDHYTYCLFGDGCMQEGIFHEAVSVAAYYNLHKLILLYDSNDIQLDGPTANSECLNHAQYFGALNFDYQLVSDGEDLGAIDAAIMRAKKTNRPSVIEIKTIIGAHSARANSASVHGAPLSAAEVAQVRTNLNYTAAPFTYSSEVYGAFADFHTRSQAMSASYQQRLAALAAEQPEQARLFHQIAANDFALDFVEAASALTFTHEASRNIVGQVYQKLVAANPTFISLNADLSGSTKIIHAQQKNASCHDHAAPNWNMGVRELAMQAINNGITAHGGMLAAGSTFLAFADYTKPALRLGAISGLNTMTVFSHDSITVGEDGPTHEPVEQLAMLRATPNVYVARPANAAEATAAFELWLQPQATSPVVIASSRAPFAIYNASLAQARHGGYVLQPASNPVITLVATGSEVGLAVAVAKILAEQDNLVCQVVSLWCWELFAEQSYEYQKSLFETTLVVAIEYGSSFGWEQYADLVIGLDTFGLSAPASAVATALELDATQVAAQIKAAWTSWQEASE